MSSFALLLPVLFPVLMGLLILLFPDFDLPRPRRFVVTMALLVNWVALAPCLLMGEETQPLFLLTSDLPLFLKADGTAKVFACVMAFVWAMAGIYSFEYMAHEGHERRYYGLYMITLGALMGLCFSGSIVTFYMFYELMTLLTMPMVMHSGKKDAVAAGLKYLIYSILGASLALLSVFLLSPYGNGFSFAPGGVLDSAKVSGHEGAVLTAAFLMLLGFSCKGGLFPLHGWLPTAHPAAPAPASAVLSGVITKAGVLGVLRTLYFYVGADFLRGTWVQTAFMALTLFTVFMGSLLAFKEGLLKKRLAWSSVSQVSYVLFGLSTLHPLGFAGALLHVIAHSLIKDTLFMGAGAVILKTGKTKVKDLAGIGKRMPKTMACFTLASLGLIGIPPCLGFVSKWYLAQGSMAMAGVPGCFNLLGPTVLLLSALLTAGYLMPIIIRGFFPGEDAPALKKCEPGMGMVIPMMILSVLMLILGAFPGGLIDLFSALAGTVL